MSSVSAVLLEMEKTNIKNLKLQKEVQKMNFNLAISESLEEHPIQLSRKTKKEATKTQFAREVYNRNTFKNRTSNCLGMTVRYSESIEHVENALYLQCKQQRCLGDFEPDCMDMMSKEFAQQYYSERNVSSNKEPLTRRERRQVRSVYGGLATMHLTVGRVETDLQLRGQMSRIWGIELTGVPVCLITATKAVYEEVRAEFIIAERKSGLPLWRVELLPDNQ